MEEKLDHDAQAPLVCSRCGIHYSDFEKTGLMGCAECYSSFDEKLSELLRRIHGSHKHIGSRPVNLRAKGTAANLLELKDRLTKAISNQNYEEAARLRDIIKDIERQYH